MNFKDEFDLQKHLVKKRKDIKSLDELITYLQYVKEIGNCGYGEAPRAIAQASLAVAWYLANEFGITGFQAGCTMWDFVRDWSYSGNKCGLRILDYDNMLFPQYDHKFEKTISQGVWDEIQKQAKENLEKSPHASEMVIEHWKSIAAGNVPFGYSVEKD